MNMRKSLAAAFSLTVAATTLAGCSTAIPTPEVPTTPSVTTQPEVPTEVSSGVDSLWSADEVSVLAKTSDRVELTVTVWDGKSLTGPTAHPFLGGGDFTITMPDEWYGSADMIAVPFRVEAVNYTLETLDEVSLRGDTDPLTREFVAVEGTDATYRVDPPITWAVVSDVAPGQSIVTTGYLLMMADNIFGRDGGAFIMKGDGDQIDASIIWHDPSERYMPRVAAER